MSRPRCTSSDRQDTPPLAAGTATALVDRPAPRRRARRRLLWAVGIDLAWFGAFAIGAYAAAGHWLVPHLIRSQALPLASQYLAGSIAVHHVSVNPFTFELHLQGVEVKDAYGDRLASATDLVVDWEPGALWAHELRFERIRVVGPWLDVRREAGGGINLARLLRDGAQQPPGLAASYRLKVEELAVVNGVATVTDQRDLTPATATLLPISFTLRNLTTGPDGLGSNALKIGLADGGTVSWQGTVSLRPMRVEGVLRISRLSAALPWRFLRDELTIAKPRGSLALAARIQFTWRDAGPELAIGELQAELSDLALQWQDDPQPFFQAARASLRDGQYDLADNALAAAELRVDQASANAVLRDGRFDWRAIMVRDPTRNRFTSRIGPKRPFAVSLQQLRLTDSRLRFENRDQPLPLQFTLNELDGTCRFLAQGGPRGDSLRIDGLQLHAAAVGLRQRDAPDDLLALTGVRLDKGTVDLLRRQVELGAVTIQGGQGSLEWLAGGTTNWRAAWRATDANEPRPLGVTPWRVNLHQGSIAQLAVNFSDRNRRPPVLFGLDPVKLSVSEVAYPFVRPVRFDFQAIGRGGGEIAANGKLRLDMGSIEGTVAIHALPLPPLSPYLAPQARVEIAHGSLSAQGSIALGEAIPGALRFSGTTQINRLELRELDGEMLLDWQGLAVPDGAIQWQPLRIAVAVLEFDQPRLVWRIREDGTSNWQGLLTERAHDPGVAVDEPTSGAWLADIDLGQIRIADGQVAFKDTSLQPPLVGAWQGLEGTITGVSTTVPEAMRLDLRGRVGKQGSVEIQGHADPLDLTGDSALDMRFRDIDMAGLTPYSARLAGQAIEAGKLSIDFSYQVANRQLAGKHRILVDGLVLGAKADDPDATQLPLGLASALLKDTKGQIALELPLTGDLAEPQFNFTQRLGQALRRRLANAVTSPFRALGAKLGVEADGLSEIWFALGRSELAPRERHKVASIALMLKRRPELQLIVRPAFSGQEEASALRMQAVNRALAERLEVSAMPVDAAQGIAFDDPTVREALEGLFTRRLGAQAWAEANRELAPDEALQTRFARLHARLAARESLPKNALRQLAIKRAQAIVEELTSEGQIAASQIHREAPAASVAVTDGDRSFVAVELSLAIRD